MERSVPDLKIEHKMTLRDISNICKVKKQPVIIQTDTSDPSDSQKVKKQPTVTSHDVTVLLYSNAAKLSCDLCCFQTTTTKLLKARQKLRAHVYAKHQDVIPQLDKDTAKDTPDDVSNQKTNRKIWMVWENLKWKILVSQSPVIYYSIY